MAFESREDQHNMQAALHKTWKDFNDCVQRLKLSFDDTNIPIDDDNVVFHRFCAKLEFLLTFGMKERSRVFGSRKNNPWHYISVCLNKTKILHEGLRYLHGANEYKTSTGRLRFFLRFCLVHNCLADTIQQCLTHSDVTNDYYNPDSFLGNSHFCSQFITALYEINDIQFDLAPTGYELDVGWPTFARKQFGHFSWKSQQPSLRSGSWLLSSTDTQSVSSLSSSFASSHRPRTGSMASNASDTASRSFGQNEVQDETDKSTAADDQLLLKVTQLAEEKGFLEQQVEMLTRQLEQEKLESQKYETLLNGEREERDRTVVELKQRVVSLEEQVAQKDSAQNRDEEKVSDEAQSSREATLIRQVTSLREAAALCKKMLNIRDEEVVLLKKQIISTECKVEAFRERYEIQKNLILEDIQNQTVELESAKKNLADLVEYCTLLAQCEHSDDVQMAAAEKLGAQILAEKFRQLLSDRNRLEKELQSVNETNQSLAKSLAHHESKLTSVTTQLDQTWAWLSRLKLQHGQLQSDEVVLRYELKEKRQLLESLKVQLEESRQKWTKIRQQNNENESAWNTIRQDLDTRKSPDESGQSNSPPNQSELACEAASAQCSAIAEAAFVPPIDLVSDIVSDEKPMPPPANGREERLLLMEEQCRLLYSKLVNTTARNAALVGRLASLHSHYSSTGSAENDATKEDIDNQENPPCQSTSDDAMVSDSVDEQEETKRMDDELKLLLADKERELTSLKDHVDALKCECATKELEQERSAQAFNKQKEALQSALERLSNSEQMVSSLQRDLQSLTGQKKEERESAESQLQQLQLCLSAKDEECDRFIEKLRSAVDEINELRAAHDQLQAELNLVRSSNSELTSQLDLLRDEALQLRNKVIDLIREKDSLWQQSDRLLYLQRVHAQDKWTPDETVRECQGCHTQFTLFNRRHHCRLCGRIFCHSCSNNWLNIAASNKRARTCNECYLIHDQFSSCVDSSQLLASSRDELDDSATSNEPKGEGSDAGACAGVSVISNEEMSHPLHQSSPK